MLKNLRRVHHIKLYSIVMILVVAGLLLYFFYYRPSHSPKKIVTAGTPITYSTKTTFSQPPAKTPASNNAAANAGGATDTHGSAASSTNSSQWTSSASGVITVKSPVPSSTLKNGDTIAGSATVDEVQYRLNDNKAGVIAQGSLSVSSGNFSGILHFKPQGTGGRLDIFSIDSKGVEYNEVQINVGF